MASFLAGYEPRRTYMGCPIGRAINDRDVIPQTLQELADTLREEWDAMPVDIVNNLVGSMPRRLHALICARDGHTRYYEAHDTLNLQAT